MCRWVGGGMKRETNKIKDKVKSGGASWLLGWVGSYPYIFFTRWLVMEKIFTPSIRRINV